MNWMFLQSEVSICNFKLSRFPKFATMLSTVSVDKMLPVNFSTLNSLPCTFFLAHTCMHTYIYINSILQFSFPNLVVSLKMEHNWIQCLFPLQFNILDSAFSVSSHFPHLHTPSLQSGMNLPSMSWMLPWAIIVSGTLTEFPYVNLKKKKKNLTIQKLIVMFYLVGRFRISSPGDSISGDPERTFSSRWGRSQVI